MHYQRNVLKSLSKIAVLKNHKKNNKNMNHHTIQLQAKIQVRDQVLRSKANVRKSNKFNNLKNIAKEMF